MKSARIKERELIIKLPIGLYSFLSSILLSAKYLDNKYRNLYILYSYNATWWYFGNHRIFV